VLSAYDLSRFGTIVDVGGGQGAFLVAVLASHPDMRGILFDQAHVVAGAEPGLRAAGVAERCQVMQGSFFEAVPEGGDAYILKMVIHDWGDGEATAILRACRRAMAPSGTLLVIERVLDRPNRGAEGKFADLQMLVGAGGRERTLAEFTTLLNLAGFRLDGVFAADAMSVVVSDPA
jgi:precorrin-6B methylase 2